MAQPNDPGRKSGAVELRLQTQTQALQDLDQQYGFFDVQFGSPPVALSEKTLEYDLAGCQIFVCPSKTEPLGEVRFDRTEYRYFHDQLSVISLFTEQDEEKTSRPLFDYLVATFGHSMNRPQAKQFAPLAHTWFSKRVRLDYYGSAGVFNLTRDRKLPKAKGACLVVTSIEIETQQRQSKRQYEITKHKGKTATAWKACQLELEDHGWKIGCKVRAGANDTEVIIELSATHRDLPDVDVQLPWPRGEKPALQDDALLNPAYAILEKRIAHLQKPRH